MRMKYKRELSSKVPNKRNKIENKKLSMKKIAPETKSKILIFLKLLVRKIITSEKIRSYLTKVFIDIKELILSWTYNTKRVAKKLLRLK
jgi:hypothetical protein